jgi:hypothetical protein
VPLNPSWLIYDGGVTKWGDGSAGAPVLLPALQEVNANLIQFNIGTLSNGQLAKAPGFSVSIANDISGGAAGQVVYQTSLNQTGFTATGTSGQSLLSAGIGTPTWGTPAYAIYANNINGGLSGQLPIQTAPNTTGFIYPNNLSVTATGSTTARTLANRFADVANVKDFGAIGDGVTDDTASFQTALNSGAKLVYIPPTNNSYLVGSLTMPTIENFVLQGSGTASKITQKAGSGSVIKWPTRATDILYPVQSIKDVHFDGQFGNDHIVNTTYVGSVEFFNCSVRNIPTNYSAFYVNGNPTDGTYTHDIYFNSCDIINNTSFPGSGNYGIAGIQLAPRAADIEINDFTFNGNFITYNAIAIEAGCGSVHIEGGHIYNTIAGVVSIVNPVDVVRINGTGIDNSELEILRAEGTNGLSIQNCRIQAVQPGRNGITLVNCANTNIGNCNFDGSAGAVSAVAENGICSYTIVSYPIFTNITSFTNPFNLTGNNSFVRGAYNNNLLGYFISFPFCGQTNLTSGLTRYFGPNGQQAVLSNSLFVIPIDGLLNQCKVYVSSPAGAGQSYTVTLYYGATVVSTGTISGASQFSVDLAIPPITSIAQDFYLTVMVVSSAGAASTIVRGFISMVA